MNKKIESFKDANIVLTNDIKGFDLQEFNFTVIVVDRKSVVYGNVNHPLKVLRDLEKSDLDLKGKIIITFEGFDDDPRDLFEVPEVRRWVSRLVKRKPHLFYFLSADTYTMLFILACLFEYEVVPSEEQVKMIKINSEPRQLATILNAVATFMLQRNESKEDIAKMVQKILSQLTTLFDE